ncbi:MAG TPA: hypothetical protein VML55_17245 [Planctomycetaceae bacterium]|nr:hypothetical protein [Planctomycetaceae bacterium]
MTVRLPALALLIASGVLALTAAGRAEGTADSPVEAPRPGGAASRPSLVELTGWIQSLSSDSYAERKAATRKLIEAGAAAIEPVARAADADDLELPGRCISILKRLAESGDEAVKHAAAAALLELTSSPREFLARKAEEALRKPPTAQEIEALARRGGFAVRQRGGGVVVLGQVRFPQPPPPQPFQPQRRSLVRELTVDEDGRKLYLRYENGDAPGPAILVRVTETVDGKPQVSEYTAAGVAELREKHPEGYALYQKHSRELYRQPPKLVAQAAPGQPAVPPAGGRIHVQMNEIGGQRDIRVVENGRQVRITETDGREIVIRVAEPADNGRPQTTEYKARDFDELKKLHPAEVVQLYERYARARNGVRVIARPGGVEIQAVPLNPVPPEPPQGAPAAPPAGVEQQDGRLPFDADRFRRDFEAARAARESRTRADSLRQGFEQARQVRDLRRQLVDAAARLRKLAEQGDVPPDELRRLADELEQINPAPATHDRAAGGR